MASALSLLERLLGECTTPAGLLDEANQVLHGDVEPLGIYVAAFVAVWHRQEGRLVYSNAGHEPPLLIRGGRGRGRRHARLRTPGTFLGAFRETRYSEQVVDLGSGDRLLLYTDGLLDLAGVKDQSALLRRLYRRLCTSDDRSANEQADLLLETLRHSTDNLVLRDDLTFLLVQF